jgi:hypothetical protein
MFALAAGYRLRSEQEATGGEPGRLATLAVPAHRADPRLSDRVCTRFLWAASSRRVLTPDRVKLKERWAVIGTHQDIFAKYGLLSHA